jgi:hypothetical protein
MLKDLLTISFESVTTYSHLFLHKILIPWLPNAFRSFGAQVLIDDNPRYAQECAEDGMRVLLFDYDNSYPWCKTGVDQSHPLVTKVHNWQEVEQKLLSWVAPES